MRVKTRAVVLVLVSLVAAVWVARAVDQAAGYKTEIETFRQKRNESLKKNWISQAGLFWLKPGTNSVGTAKNNDVVLTKGPALVGSFDLNSKDVTLRLNAGVQATVDGKPATPSTKMALDTSGSPTQVALGSLRITVIERDGQIGVRVKDTDSAAAKSFKGTEWFPVDQKLRVEAKWVPATGKK